MLTLDDFGVKREQVILSNGSKLIFFEKPKTPVSIRATFISGSRFDPIGKDGTAHFLEHMIVAGSKRFPSKDKLANYIEQYGGVFSASTSIDTIDLKAVIGDPNDLKYIFEIFHEMLLESLFDENTIEKERGSILRELSNKKSDPSSMIWEVYRRLFFQNTEVGRSTLGSEKNIEAISKKDIVEFRNDQFLSGKLLFTASGGAEFNRLKENFENSLILPKSERISFLNDLPLIREKVISIEPYPGITEAHIIYGFRSPRVLHPDEAALNVIAQILGGGRASTLSKKLRYEKGLVYSVSALSMSMADCGAWVIKTATSKDKVNEVIGIITDEIKRVMTDGLTDEEIIFAKNKIIKSKLMQMQTSSDWVAFHGYYSFFDESDTWTIEDYLKEIELVTPEKTKEVANKYFGQDKWFLGICGDVKEESIDVSW